MSLFDQFVLLVQGLLAFFGIGYRVDTRITRVNLSDIGADELEEERVLLDRNEAGNRIFYYGYNESSVSVRIADNNEPATEKRFTTIIGDNSGFPAPGINILPYQGKVTYNPVSATSANVGYLTVTEYVLVRKR